MNPALNRNINLSMVDINPNHSSAILRRAYLIKSSPAFMS